MAADSLPREVELDEMCSVQGALYRVLKSLVFRDDPGEVMGDMPISQLRCLHTIAEHEGLKMNDLSHRMEVKLPAASQLVNRLVKRGMVVRHADPDDRRVVRLELTEGAWKLLDEAKERREARMKATLAEVAPAAIGQVVQGLTLLAKAAEAVVSRERGPDAAAEDIEPDLVALSQRASRTRAANPDVNV